MKRLIAGIMCVTLYFASSIICYAAENAQPSVSVIVLVSEQNIQAPQRAWWAGQIDISATEQAIVTKLKDAGIVVFEPSQLESVIKQDKAFTIVNVSDESSRKLGSLAKADFVIVGKAIATSGVKVPQSNMLSCFANISAKVIKVKDGTVSGYVDASGSVVHIDAITGGKEALTQAANDAAEKIVLTINKSKTNIP